MRADDLLYGTGFRLELSSLALVADQLADAEITVPRTARILHEYDHLVRLLGTSYGLLRYGFLSHYLHHFLRAFDQLESVEDFHLQWNDLRLRVGDKMIWQEFKSIYFGQSVAADLYRAQCCLGAIGVLDGKKLDSISIGALAGWGEYCNSATGERASDGQTLYARMDRLWGHNVPKGTSLIYIDGRPITVPDILEYLGIVVEAAYQVQFGEGPAQFPDDLPPRTYLQILNVIKEYLPRALNPAAGLMAQELEALFELALWIPFWPGIHDDELPSHGVHLIPSYRLQAILDTCKLLGKL